MNIDFSDLLDCFRVEAQYKFHGETEPGHAHIVSPQTPSDERGPDLGYPYSYPYLYSYQNSTHITIRMDSHTRMGCALHVQWFGFTRNCQGHPENGIVPVV